jgi:hypothetical protein
LERVLTSTENNQVVSQQIIVLKHITHSRRILKRFQFGFRGFTVVELVVVAGL